MSFATSTYHELLEETLNEGVQKGDRTGTGTIATFGKQKRFGTHTEFPLITSKKIFFRGVIEELLWFIRGDTNNNSLADKKVNFWTPWADKNGDLGPVYGHMWRSWPTTGGTIDQLLEAQRLLREEPDSRRIIVNAWNPEFLPDPSLPPKENPAQGKQALPPCHMMFQFQAAPLSIYQMISVCMREGIPIDLSKMTTTFVDLREVEPDFLDIPEEISNRRVLHLQVYIRSNDLFLGAPFNIASYAALLQMMAQCVDMERGDLVYTVGDCHIYNNHMEQVRLQLDRWKEHVSTGGELSRPVLKLNPDVKDITEFTWEDFTLENYNPLGAIKGTPAV